MFGGDIFPRSNWKNPGRSERVLAAQRDQLSSLNYREVIEGYCRPPLSQGGLRDGSLCNTSAKSLTGHAKWDLGRQAIAYGEYFHFAVCPISQRFHVATHYRPLTENLDLQHPLKIRTYMIQNNSSATFPR
ncbi:hypothetical protein TNCV_1404131 [Trichonephila clavipes]|nr:hypothetical protein TNCV_1404131 [Trichonephila clavipes]